MSWAPKRLHTLKRKCCKFWVWYSLVLNYSWNLHEMLLLSKMHTLSFKFYVGLGKCQNLHCEWLMGSLISWKICLITKQSIASPHYHKMPTTPKMIFNLSITNMKKVFFLNNVFWCRIWFQQLGIYCYQAFLHCTWTYCEEFN